MINRDFLRLSAIADPCELGVSFDGAEISVGATLDHPAVQAGVVAGGGSGPGEARGQACGRSWSVRGKQVTAETIDLPERTRAQGQQQEKENPSHPKTEGKRLHCKKRG